jgi:hypothetical protein
METRSPLKLVQPSIRDSGHGSRDRHGSGANAWVAGDEEEMQRFVPIEEPLRRADHPLVCRLVHELAAEPTEFGNQDGGSRDLGDPYNDPALGVALPARIRKALEALRSPVGGSWGIDETYIRFTDNGCTWYRAVDKARQTLDFYLSRNRDAKAAQSFLRSAMKNTGVPRKITWDAYAASHRAGARDAGRRRTSGSRPGSIQPTLEQSGGAGPSESAATNPADAGIPAIRPCGGNDFRDRASRERSRRGSSRLGGSAGAVRRCRNCRTRRSLLQPIAVHQPSGT